MSRSAPLHRRHAFALAAFTLAALTAASGCNCGDRLSRSRSQIKADPASLDFGTQPAGTSLQKSVTLSNAGTARLTISDAHFEDDARSAFTVSGMPAGIDPGSSAIVAITYTAPQAEGPDGASLLITSDADNAPELRISVSARSIQSCGPGTIACATGCTNPMTDHDHCGSCAIACGETESCTDGVCACVPKTCLALNAACGMQSDGCGGKVDCGTCAGTATCDLGACLCQSGETTETVCGDAIDDDCDGKVDCDDPDCAGANACTGCLAGTDLRITDDALINSGSALVWTGSKLGLIWQQSDGSQPYSYGFAQVLPDGTIADAPHDVTPPPASVAHAPSIDWTGSHYGLAWSDIRNAAAQMSNDVYFGALDANGARSVGDLQLVGGMQLSFMASVAWNASASEHGVVYTDNRDSPASNDTELYFSRVDATGAKVGTDVRVTNAPGTADHPSIVATPNGQYGIAFHDNRSGAAEIYFVLLDSTGARITSTDVKISTSGTGAYTPSLTFGNGQFGIVWADTRHGNPELYFRRVSAAGVPSGSEVRVTTALGGVHAPRIASDGTGWGVTWSDTRSGMERVYFAALSLDGAPLKAESALTCGGTPAISPAIAWTGSKWAVAWSDLRDGGPDYEIYARIFSTP